jgi:hypothetical protein
MSKSTGTRLLETLRYVYAFDPGLADHLRQILNSCADQDGVLEDIGKAISLSGKTPWFHADRANNTDTQRDALRALLLCQRVYLTSVWAPKRFGQTPYVANGTWPAVTIDRFRFRPEMEIRNAIGVYSRAAVVTADALADAAARRGDDANFYYTHTRNSPDAPPGMSCYDQVSKWLLHSGHVSMRWLAKFSPINNDFAAFGPERVHIGETDAMPRGRIDVPRGMIVRMFTRRRPGGHFMVSDGNGWGWGFNNSSMEGGDGEGRVPNGHARCLIHRQFAEYRGDDDVVSPGNFGGKMVLYDPARIPLAD